MPVLDPQALDQLRRLVSRFGELLAARSQSAAASA
jgi:hypothetical protein